MGPTYDQSHPTHPLLPHELAPTLSCTSPLDWTSKKKQKPPQIETPGLTTSLIQVINQISIILDPNINFKKKKHLFFAEPKRQDQIVKIIKTQVPKKIRRKNKTLRQKQFPISAQINHYTSHDRNQLNTIIHQINNIRIKSDGGEKKRTKDFRLGSLDLSCPRVNRSGKKAKQNRENRETGVGITFVLFLLWLLLWMLQWKPSILLLQPYFPQSWIRRRKRRRRWCLGFSSVGDLERKRPSSHL